MATTIAKTQTGIGRQALIYGDNEHFTVQLYATVIYDETADSITLDNGGWITSTTARYMIQALNYRGHQVRVFIRNSRMFWQSPCGNPQPFVDGKAVIRKSGTEGR